ncbi:hypothetical protein HY950_03560 [Candidatus Gottesmanbacteria bacterium]|nr:hypothetical protein [Candidatus Gottesmanbacteria bacterium]
MKKKIIVGLDFDGVVAYSPLRILRLPVALAKRHLLGIRETHFWVPKTPLEKKLWSLAFSTSVFPGRGTALLRQLANEGIIEAHLVTARFSFMQNNLNQWLHRRGMHNVFSGIILNTRDEQPHLFKERIINAKRFDYFIEDNLDIVRYLTGRTKTNVFWIYNILDHATSYPYKFPYLEKALRAIVRSG